MIYRCLYFKIEELVSPEIIDVLGNNGAWCLISRWCRRLDDLRVAYGGKLVCNDRKNKYRGIRPQKCDIGAPQSRHKLTVPYIAAFDLICDDLDRLTEIVMTRWRELGVARMERPEHTPGWRHIEFVADGYPLPPGLSLFSP